MNRQRVSILHRQILGAQINKEELNVRNAPK